MAMKTIKNQRFLVSQRPLSFRKAFFFSLDAFFAILIFTLMLVSVYGYFVGTQELRQQYYFSEDLFDIFINTKMGELSFYEEGDGNFRQYVLDNHPSLITLIDGKLTIMEQIITLNNNATEEFPEANIIAEHLIDTLMEIFDDRYGFNLNVEDWFYVEEEGQQGALVSRQRFVSGVEFYSPNP